METSRRALLKGAPVAAVAFAIPATSVASEAVDRAEWERALAELHRVKAEDEAFTPGWWKAWQECKEECDAIPHAVLRPDPHTGLYQPVTTANSRFVSLARDTVKKVEAGKMRFEDHPNLQEHLRLCRDTAVAADERDLKVAAVRARYDMDALDDRAEELGDLIADAQSKVMEVPAPDLAALRVKLLMLPDERDGGMPSWTADYVRQTFEDVKRLLPASA